MFNVGRIFFKGEFVFFPHYSSDDLIFFVILWWNIEITSTERNWGYVDPGWIRLEIFFEKTWTGPFDLIGYINGICRGDI